MNQEQNKLMFNQSFETEEKLSSKWVADSRIWTITDPSEI